MSEIERDSTEESNWDIRCTSIGDAVDAILEEIERKIESQETLQ